MGFNFWHDFIFKFTPTGAFEQTKNLWNLLGIAFSLSTERSAKLCDFGDKQAIYPQKIMVTVF
jgi:hypothetical protein